MEVLIGIDIGTGSAKAVAFDVGNAKIIETSQQSYSTRYNGIKHEQNPDEIFKGFQKVLNKISAKVGYRNIKGVVFSSALHSLIAVDENCVPLTPCIIWSDHRSFEQAKFIKSHQDSEKVYFATGTPIHPMSPLSKIRFLKENENGLFERSYKFIGIKEYIFFKLFNQYIVDYSIASATGLFDIENKNWYQPALDLAGISSDQLSNPVPTTYSINGFDRKLMEEIHILPDTPFICGGGDGPLANLGALAIQEQMKACLTLGTSGAVRFSLNQPLKDKKQRVFNYLIDEDLYAAGGAVNNGGIVLNWLGKLFYQDDDVYETLINECRDISPGSEGLLFVPWILGERAPVWDSECRGRYEGVSYEHGKGHFLRSSLEGICFNLKYIIQTLETLSTPVDLINFNGGLSQSTFMCQVLADIFDKEVIQLPEIDLSAYGAIMLALKSMGKINQFNETPKLKAQLKHYYPDSHDALIYKTSFKRFKHLIDQTFE